MGAQVAAVHLVARMENPQRGTFQAVVTDQLLQRGVDWAKVVQGPGRRGQGGQHQQEHQDRAHRGHGPENAAGGAALTSPR